MPSRILFLTGLLWLGVQAQAQARVLEARIERIDSPVATLERVRVRLEWPPEAAQGRLRIEAARARAPDLGYRFSDLAWECPLGRDPGPAQAWTCAGELRAGRAAPMRLAVDIGPATLDAALSQGAARLSLARRDGAPDDARIDLARVPLAWAQALASQAWTSGRLGAGTVDGTVRVRVPAQAGLQLDADLALSQGAFETADASMAGEGLDARLQVGVRNRGQTSLVSVDGSLGGGALLFGNAFVDLPDMPVPLSLAAMREGAQAGWRLPRFEWSDGPTLAATGSARLAPDASVRELELHLASDDTSELPARYLSGWLALAGLSDLRLDGGLVGHLHLLDGHVREGWLRMHGLDVREGGERFVFDGLDGEVRLASGPPVESELGWRGGAVSGLRFGSARLPLRGGGGQVQLREPFAVEMLGGRLRFDDLHLRPPGDGHGLRLGFGLAVDALEVEQLARAMGWPAFGGTLSGEIPAVRYEHERLEFDGGLAVRVFDGRLDVSALSMDRPFGVAPTLSADFALHELDLFAVTEVFDLGNITGRLSGRIDGLRLVDWRLSSFDAQLQTVPRPGVRQRISQRAVENITSVGDGSFIGGLQGQLVGFFDDFRYARIGISCRLANEVCRMGGLRSAGNAFTIVEGAGLPRLQVIGHNRNVDWPTLVERVGAAIGGETSPVVD